MGSRGRALVMSNLVPGKSFNNTFLSCFIMHSVEHSNSRTFQGLSSTYSVFKDFQGPGIFFSKFKDFQGLLKDPMNPGVCSDKCRHQSPDWTILSQVDCVIQEEVLDIIAGL